MLFTIQNQFLKYFLSLLFISCLMLQCTTVSHQSEFRATPVNADGNSAEWSLPLNYYDAETQLNYAFSNDKENIYICMRTAESVTKRKIFKMGLRLGIEVQDKKSDQKISIIYPNPPKELNKDEEEAKEEPGIGGIRQRKKERYLGEMQLSGFNQNIGTSLPPKNDFGLNVAVKEDSNNVMVYEAVIPFKTFYKDAITFSDCKKEWMLTVNLTGLPDRGGKRINDGGMDPMSGGNSGGGRGGMGAMGGMGGRGGGGGGMGGRGGGGGRGAHAEVNPLHQSASLKVAFHPVLK